MNDVVDRPVTPEDCRRGMRAIDDGSVSLVLTDPPYFTDGMDDGWSHETLRRRRDRSNGAVGGLPGGMKFDPAQGRRLQKFLAPIAAEWMRVVKPGGFVLCFSQPRLAHRTAVAIEDAGFEIRDLYVWSYGDGQCKAFSQAHFIRRMNLPESEKTRLIGELGGRKTPQLKPQMETIVMAQAPRDGTYAENWLAHRVGLVDTSADNNLLEAGRVPGTIMPARKPREKYGHMTVKPVDLLRHLIRLFTDTGALVLDPFAGTGSTGVAAKIEGRAFAGFEIDAAMSDVANVRIGETAAHLDNRERWPARRDDRDSPATARPAETCGRDARAPG